MERVTVDAYIFPVPFLVILIFASIVVHESIEVLLKKRL
jgi:hypothetical protein